jgi:cellulose synthase/poly-beta-1,6-N-acetylglucosamine synthase-like glycosyltransferase
VVLASLPPAEPTKSAPEDGRRLSVLVAAWNEAEGLGAFIDSFAALSYRNKELILCAGGTDGTLAIARARACEGVRVLEQLPGEGKQGALRKCLEHSSGDIIFLTDADCRLTDAGIQATLSPIVQDGEQAAIGSYAPFQEQRTMPLVLYRWCWDLYSGIQRQRYFSTKGVNGVNFAVTRRALDEVGGFAADVKTGTDYHLALQLTQAGHRVRLVPESVIETDYYTSPAGYVRWTSRGLRSGILLSPGFGERAEAVQLLRNCLRGTAVFGLPLAALFMGRIALNAWFCLVLNYWLVRLRYLLFFHKHQRLPLRWRSVAHACVFSFLDFTAQALALLQCIFPRWRDKW